MGERISPLIGAKIISIELDGEDIISIELETTDGKRILLNPEAYVGWENEGYIEWDYMR